MKTSNVALVAVGWCLLTLSGCGPPPVAVEGRVTLDGLSLDEAIILFVPIERGRRKTGAAVNKGTYRVEARDGLLPGRYRVEIADNPPLSSARHGVPDDAPRPTGARRRIPASYGVDSPLVTDVTDGRPWPVDFELRSER
jgi:hypothetical protein